MPGGSSQGQIPPLALQALPASTKIALRPAIQATRHLLQHQVIAGHLTRPHNSNNQQSKLGNGAHLTRTDSSDKHRVSWVSVQTHMVTCQGPIQGLCQEQQHKTLEGWVVTHLGANDAPGDQGALGGGPPLLVPHLSPGGPVGHREGHFVPGPQLHIPLHVTGVEIEPWRFGAFQIVLEEAKGALEGKDAAGLRQQRHLRRAPPCATGELRDLEFRFRGLHQQ